MVRLSRWACVLLVITATLMGCQSMLEKGIPGITRYMQFVSDGEVFWEYAVAAGSMSCEMNAALNNKQLAMTKETEGRYVCASQPAPESQLPYSYVSYSAVLTSAGIIYSAATTTRYANAESCQVAVSELERNERKLVSEKCGSKSVPRVRPGETLSQSDLGTRSS
jgi:hypothetical protein